MPRGFLDCTATFRGRLRESPPGSGEGLWDVELRGWGEWQNSVVAAMKKASESKRALLNPFMG